MRKKRILSIFAAVAMAFYLAGCQSDKISTGQVELIDEESQQTTAVIEETTKESEQINSNTKNIVQTDEETQQVTNKTTDKTTDYDLFNYPVYPVPDGWSFEKICSLIEINGAPLKFPCTLEEFSNINNNITIEKPNDGLGFHDIYYNNINVGSLSFNNDTGISNFIRFNYYDDDTEECIDVMTFAGYTAEQEAEINNFMDENFNLSDDRSEFSSEDFYRKVYEFEQSDKKMEFTICFDDSKLYLIRIKLEELGNE